VRRAGRRIATPLLAVLVVVTTTDVIFAVDWVKMLLIDVWHVPIWLSLAVIAGVLTVTVLLSLRTTPRSRTAA
jgi:tellurite resistance protein TerC